MIAVVVALLATLLQSPAAPPAAPHVEIGSALVGGRATWYNANGNIAAAGPALRGYLGRNWRGALVSVCAPSSGRCVVVKVSDWCLCTGGGGRLLDLSDDAFSKLAPLSKGVLNVEVTRVVYRHVAPPATDTL
jgi:hypothetical protein